MPGNYKFTPTGWICSKCEKTTNRYYHECPSCGDEKDGTPGRHPRQPGEA